MPIPTQPEASDRYSRQMLFSGVGAAGQARLAKARVAVVGCGATGSVLASLLARAGVGSLRIIDRDYVETSNLQRQLVFDENDAAQSLPKAIAAQRKLTAANSQISVEALAADLTPASVEELLGSVELIMDGTDNFETRYLINDFAVAHQLPWIYCAAVGSHGTTLNIISGRTACLRCMFPSPPSGTVETCDTAGILNSAAASIAAIAATEAIKILVGAEQELRRTLLSIDLWKNQRAEIAADRPQPDCLACIRQQFPFLSGEHQPQITLCGRNSVQIHERNRPVSFSEMAHRLEGHGTVRHNEFVLKFWMKPYEMTLFPDGRAIIKGTTDTAVARSLYARYIGS
jgi:molybdopterin/thiamine biosynthesis adenylyltransferase